MSTKELTTFRNTLTKIIEKTREFDAASPMNIRNISIKKTITDDVEYLHLNHNGIFVPTTNRVVDIMLLPSSEQYKKLSLVLMQAKKVKKCSGQKKCITDISLNNIKYTIFNDLRLDQNYIVQSWKHLNYGENGTLVFENHDTICHLVTNNSPSTHFRVNNINDLDSFYLENKDFIKKIITPFLVPPQSRP